MKHIIISTICTVHAPWSCYEIIQMKDIYIYSYDKNSWDITVTFSLFFMHSSHHTWSRNEQLKNISKCVTTQSFLSESVVIILTDDNIELKLRPLDKIDFSSACNPSPFLTTCCWKYEWQSCANFLMSP